MQNYEECVILSEIFFNEGGWNIFIDYLIRPVSNGFIFEKRYSVADIQGFDPSVKTESIGRFRNGAELHELSPDIECDTVSQINPVFRDVLSQYMDAAKAAENKYQLVFQDHSLITVNSLLK